MDTALLIVRLLLAGVFAVSAVAKLADRPGSREALAGFGVPARLVIPGAIALPLAELALAVLLLPRTTAWWGALGALVLLLAFVAGIGVNLAKGRRPDCHCFGKLHSEPIGPGTLVRDGFLAAGAAFVLIGGWDDSGPGVNAWLGDLSTGETVAVLLAVVAVAAVGVEGWLLTQVMGQYGRLLLRLEAIEKHLKISPLETTTTSDAPAGLPTGTPAPAFRLEGIYGETQTLDALRAAGKPVLLVFTDPRCGPCNALMPDLRRWQDDNASALTVAVIGRGTVEANRAKAAEHGLAIVLLQRDREVATAYRATKTPSAVLVNAAGTIGGPVAGGSDAIRQLVADAIRVPTPAEVAVLAGQPVGAVAVGNRPPGRNGLADDRAPEAATGDAPAVKRGEPAPAVKLNDLDGDEFDLARYRGQAIVLLFWSPSCGYCERIVPHLQEWEAHPPEGAPQIILVARGSADANRELGLRSRIVLDNGVESGRAFGATGTPSAVLIDAEGRIASEVAAGGRGVLDLIGYDAVLCQPCLEECRQRGGGDACRSVCQMAGRCL